ncbi:MAG: hypothetical protein ACODAA_07605 [Gemmatimonadota bacterium]
MATVKVKYSGRNMYTVRTGGRATPFLPGINRVDADRWARIRRHPGAKRRIAAGALAVVGEESEDKPPTAAELAQEASETYDLDRLRELAEDDRVTVQRAAKKQIAAIEAAGKTEEGGDPSGDGDDPSSETGGASGDDDGDGDA